MKLLFSDTAVGFPFVSPVGQYVDINWFPPVIDRIVRKGDNGSTPDVYRLRTVEGNDVIMYFNLFLTGFYRYFIVFQHKHKHVLFFQIKKSYKKWSKNGPLTLNVYWMCTQFRPVRKYSATHVIFFMMLYMKITVVNTYIIILRYSKVRFSIWHSFQAIPIFSSFRKWMFTSCHMKWRHIGKLKHANHKPD